jgi:hypothetical protein
MGSFSIWHWLIVLVIVMLIFGTKEAAKQIDATPPSTGQTIDVEARDKTKG